MSNFVARLWRGDIPLARTYWVYGTIVGIIIGLILRLLRPLLTYIVVAVAADYATYIMYTYLLLILLLIIAYEIVILVGVWRSANKYAIAKPTKVIYATLAKCTVIIGISFNNSIYQEIISAQIKTLTLVHNSRCLQQTQTVERIGLFRCKILLQNGSMNYGYARVSTDAQDLTSQLAQLKAAGCTRVFREKISGATADRPQLRKLMATVSDGDVVIILLSLLLTPPQTSPSLCLPC